MNFSQIDNIFNRLYVKMYIYKSKVDLMGNLVATQPP